jgi:glycosyltransferase involved in cell wall biosynthesis
LCITGTFETAKAEVAQLRLTVKIAHVSTFPEMRCGIAFYAQDLISSLPHANHVKYALHYGNNPTGDAAAHADVSKPDSLRRLAKVISRSDCDVVSLQHEFGIWGGRFGENIGVFLDHLTKPVVSTLHTTFHTESRDPLLTQILRRVVRHSRRVLVLTVASRETIQSMLDFEAKNIVVVPHGMPDIEFVRAPTTWNSAGSGSRQSRNGVSLVSIGFFRPDKGIEIVLLELWRLKRRGIRFSYVIAGEPQRQFDGQSQYLTEIRALVETLDLQNEVTILDRFLTVQEQIDLIHQSHVGVFAYQDPVQSSSGTVPLVLAAGRPVVCTPFEFAVAKKKEIPGITIAKGFGGHAFAEALLSFIENRNDYRRVTRLVHQKTRPWTWRVVGRQYLEQYVLAGRR